MIIYLVLLLSFSFYFHFYSPISFTCTLPILFDFVLDLLLYRIFVLLYLLSFILLFIPRYPLSQNVRWTATASFFFTARHIWKHVLILLLVFLKLLFFEMTCFKFYLIAVDGVFCGQVYCGWPWTWQEMRSGLFQMVPVSF